MSDSEGSDNLDAPQAAPKLASPPTKHASPSKRQLNNNKKSSFGVARDVTPETPMEEHPSESEVPTIPTKRKQSSDAKPKPKAKKASAFGAQPNGSSDEDDPPPPAKKTKESKFFAAKESPKKQKKTAFGVGHSDDDQDQDHKPDADDAAEEQEQDYQVSDELDDAEVSEEELPKKKKGKGAAKKNQKQPSQSSKKRFPIQLESPESVPKGQISKSTMQFLKALQLQSCNDREWFAIHDAQYRHAWKQWQDFVDAFNPQLQMADPEIPELPPKDLVHRIYRDVRFSSDKRPYKTVLSASTSRGGRKGKFAGYYIQIRANNTSLLASGIWCPDKDDIATFRHNLLADPDQLKNLISAQSFVDTFGPPEPIPRPQKPKKPAKKRSPKKAKKEKDGDEDDDSQIEEEVVAEQEKEPAAPEASRRQSIFGHDDELVNAPKGYPKDHPLIDFLRLRTIAVSKTFTDDEVQSPDFMQKIRATATEMAPFVHLLNEMLIPGAFTS